MPRRRVYLDQLVDTAEVAKILGLSRPSNVSMYARRYPDMPRPVLESGPGHPAWWIRGEVEAWQRKRQTR